MLIETKKASENTTSSHPIVEVRKTYIKPMLEVLGDLRTSTLGGSPLQVGDISGNFNTGPFA